MKLFKQLLVSTNCWCFILALAFMGNPLAVQAETFVDKFEESMEQNGLTINNNGACAVNIYWWKSDGDVFYTTIEAGGQWYVNTADGHTWRAVDTDNVWSDLKYDESYTVNHNATQTWNITPTYCETSTLNVGLTIKNGGECTVNIYWWKADGDVFFETIQPGAEWYVNTNDGDQWRAVDTDNVWSDLKYDESYTANHNATQVWNITPNYCVATTPEIGLTIKNGGECAVNIYWWKADGDVFFETIQPGAEWYVNTNDGDQWRAVDTDNVWSDLKYDESYTVNHNATQVWNITPNYCVTTTTGVGLTIKNGGECAVNIYWWKADGDVFFETIQPGAEWYVNTTDGHQWRAVDTDNVWSDLKYDESYTANHNTTQVWNITPNYCVATTPDIGLTIKNGGACAVNIYWWKADGDVFFETIQPGAEWYVNTTDGHQWRAVDTDNVWSALKYDESYTVNHNTTQVWNITPNYCVTTPTNPDPTCNANYSSNGRTINVSNLVGAIKAVKIIDAQWNTIYSCDDWGTNPCGGTESFTVPTCGTYSIQIQTYSDWSTPICNIFVTIEINSGCGNTPPVTPVYDCPALSANIGDACNDGNANTTNDSVQGNCTCAGTAVAPVYDCPALNANIGDACNDGNANTNNDVVTANCGCAGTPTGPTSTTCDATYRVDGDKIVIEGLNAPIVSAKILSNTWATIAECSDWSTACGGMLMATVQPGDYFVQIQTYSDWSNQICDVFETVTVVGGNTGGNTGGCDNVYFGGTIASDETICSGENASTIRSTAAPDGGSGAIEYLWLSSTTGCPRDLSQAIAGANGATYNPGVLTQTTYYVRCSRRAGCDTWTAGESNCVVINVRSPNDIFFDNPCNPTTTPTVDCPALNANIGDACNDGNADTENDQVQSDCSCAGTPTAGGGCNIAITSGSDYIQVTGVVGTYPSVGISDDFGNVVYQCHAFNGGCPTTIRVDGLAPGVYWVNATVLDSDWVTVLCEAAEDPVVGGARLGNGNLTENFVVEGHDVQATNEVVDFKVFPNPANETVNVSLIEYEGKDVTIQMIDFSGKPVKSISIDNVNDTKVAIPIESVSNGIYTVRILSNGIKPVGKKMIVNKQF